MKKPIVKSFAHQGYLKEEFFTEIARFVVDKEDEGYELTRRDEYVRQHDCVPDEIVITITMRELKKEEDG